MNYNGPDSFTYRAFDGVFNSNVATVNITVNPVNDPPVAVNDGYAATEDAVLVVPAPASSPTTAIPTATRSRPSS